MHGVPCQQFLGARNDLESPAPLFQLVDFAGRVNLRWGGRRLSTVLLGSNGSRRQQKNGPHDASHGASFTGSYGYFAYSFPFLFSLRSSCGSSACLAEALFVACPCAAVAS